MAGLLCLCSSSERRSARTRHAASRRRGRGWGASRFTATIRRLVSPRRLYEVPGPVHHNRTRAEGEHWGGRGAPAGNTLETDRRHTEQREGCTVRRDHVPVPRIVQEAMIGREERARGHALHTTLSAMRVLSSAGEEGDLVRWCEGANVCEGLRSLVGVCDAGLCVCVVGVVEGPRSAVLCLANRIIVLATNFHATRSTCRMLFPAVKHFCIRTFWLTIAICNKTMNIAYVEIEHS